MPVTIRPLASDDRAVWETLFDGYAAFYKLVPTAAGKSAVWGWIFDENNDFWGDLAWDAQGTAVGMMQYQLMHRSLSGEMVVYLSDLFVRPDVRGGGVGRALIDHVIGFAQGRGISNVRWLTQEFNYAGRRLYDTYRPKTDLILYSVPVER
ncbi:MAG: GNAT family N-acetyltransferase [Paracoccaceae bacterium]